MRRRRSRASEPREAGGVSGWAVGILVVLVMGVALAVMLLRPGVGYRTHLLEFASTDYSEFLGHGPRAAAVPMQRGLVPGEGFSLEIEFQEATALPRQNLRSIDLMFDVRRAGDVLSEEKARTRILRGELRNLESGRAWVARRGAGLRTESLVEFLELKDSSVAGLMPEGVAGTNALHRWRLSLWTADPVDVAVRCHLIRPLEGAPPVTIGKLATKVGSRGGSERWAFPHGRYTTWFEEGDGPRRRVELLGLAWGREGVGWLLGWVTVAVLAAGTGAGLLSARVAGGEVPGPRWVRTMVATGLAFFGMGLLPLLFTPPYLGVDEPTHTLTSHVWLGDEPALKSAWEFGKRTHYSRLLFHPGQKWTVADAREPREWFISSPADWNLEPLKRSPTDARLTRATRWFVMTDAPGMQLFRMRLLRLWVVAFGVGLAAGILGRRAPEEPGVHWLGWIFVWVASLGYFGMTVSNYPLLVACYVVLGAFAAAIVNQDRLGWRWMLLLGLAAGLAVHTSLNGIVSVVVPASAVLALALFRPKAEGEMTEGHPEGAVGWAGWGALGAGLLLARVVSTPEYDEAIGKQLGVLVRERLGWPVPPYWVVVVAGCGLLGVVERVMQRFLPLDPGTGRGRGMRWVGGLSLAACLGLLVNAVLPSGQLGMLMEAVPLWEYVPNQGQFLARTDYPAPPDPAPTPGGYAWSALKCFLASWGPGDADFMTSRLFWQTAGFLDTLTPDWVRWFLTTVLGLGLALQLWRVSNRSNRVRFGRLMLVLVGVVAVVVLLAVGARVSVASPSLHGRYLLGVYIMVLPLLFSGWKGLLLRWQVRRPVRLTMLLVCPAVVLHLVSGWTMLERYLGS